MKLPRAITAVLVAYLVVLSISVTWYCLYASASSPEPVTRPVNIVLISWDGVQRDHFYELLGKGALPNIAALSAEGSLVNVTITDHTTDTKAGHSEMLTGYGPEITGVFNNRNYSPIPEGYTIFERAESAFGTGAIVTMMVTGKTHHLGAERGEPFHNARFALDVFVSNGAGADVIGPKAINYLNYYIGNHFFAFFHFSDPDSKGHVFGENSREYEGGIIACDLWLGRIIETLRNGQVYGSTVILVTSDHGFDEGQRSHRNAPYVFAASNRHLRGNGDQKDIAPTLLGFIGIDPNRFNPPLLGVSRAATQILGFAEADYAWQFSRVLDVFSDVVKEVERELK